MAQLCQQLAAASGDLEQTGGWPGEQLRLCGQYGVFEWFISPQAGGQGWDGVDITRAYLALGQACLTTAFVITQRTGACQRIAGSHDEALKEALLPDLLSGRRFATVGISHLTTSRRHLGKPVLLAQETPDGFVLDGYSPWVTGAPQADTVVVGASLEDGRQVLIALPMDLPGISCPAPAELVGLTASQTGPVECRQVEVDQRYVLAGPVEGVLQQGSGAGTGGLQTSTLALGLAAAALTYAQGEAAQRSHLDAPVQALQDEHGLLCDHLLAAAAGTPQRSNEDLRVRVNSLVLRATQVGLAAAKGTGYAAGHSAGRWCREALFFLVWSCPQPVVEKNLRELAGMAV